jgi:hypothetical protein
MKITVELNFIESDKDCIKINYYENTADRSKLIPGESYKWYNDSSSIIDLYKNQSDDDNRTNEYVFHTLSHELGHAMGLGDAYADIEVNNGYEIYTYYTDPNLEFPPVKLGRRNTYEAGEIMASNGLPCSNDIEMILQAFVEDKNQLFVNSSNINENELIISKAIKNPVIIYIKYYYDGTNRATYYIHLRKNDTIVKTDYIEVLMNYVDEYVMQ